jgi:hypothetical protein
MTLQVSNTSGPFPQAEPDDPRQRSSITAQHGNVTKLSSAHSDLSAKK